MVEPPPISHALSALITFLKNSGWFFSNDAKNLTEPCNRVKEAIGYLRKPEWCPQALSGAPSEATQMLGKEIVEKYTTASHMLDSLDEVNGLVNNTNNAILESLD